MSNITIVTAFFDIGRGNWPGFLNRTTDTYFESFERLAKLKNDMVVYTSENFVDRVIKIRERVSPGSKTNVFPIDFESYSKNFVDKVRTIQERPEYIQFVGNPRLPEYWNPYYVAVNYRKSGFVVNAILKGVIDTDLIAWIDFGYARTDDTIPKSLEWDYDFDPFKMHYFTLKPIDFDRPIFDVVRTNDVTVMGCHIVGGRNAWSRHQHDCLTSMESLMQCGLVDDDQTIMLMNYLREYNKWPIDCFYELHPIDETKKGWFVIFNDFNKKG